MFQRSSGILLHISSLPGEYGIGDFGKEAYKFVDFLEESGVKNWQILPLGITGYGDSPYQSFSAFAGNPYFIDFDELISLKLITEDEILDAKLNANPKKIDYAHLYEKKMSLLRLAYRRGKEALKRKLKGFYAREYIWLQEFALYMAIKEHHGQKSWLDWEPAFRIWQSEEVKNFEKENQDAMGFWIFTQYFFDKQWMALKGYANSKNIKIIGDLPVYVSDDSADVWKNPDLFKLDEERKPITVAGVPPDAFSKTGQLWGNPIYDWENMRHNGYQWWTNRIAHSFKLYDVLRIDHFRGFEAYWEIPYGEDTAMFGDWTKGPGIELFHKIKEELGDLKIIAEDLGYLTKDVEKLIEATGYPGMKVLQFAFDPREESDYLPHNYPKNSVVYTGTHDNHTVLGWADNIPNDELEFAKSYLKLDEEEGYPWGMIRGSWSSVSDLAIAPMQEFLNLDDDARMNIPSTLGGNWEWRVEKQHLTEILAHKIHRLNDIYRRL